MKMSTMSEFETMMDDEPLPINYDGKKKIEKNLIEQKIILKPNTNFQDFYIFINTFTLLKIQNMSDVFEKNSCSSWTKASETLPINFDGPLLLYGDQYDFDFVKKYFEFTVLMEPKEKHCFSLKTSLDGLFDYKAYRNFVGRQFVGDKIIDYNTGLIESGAITTHTSGYYKRMEEKQKAEDEKLKKLSDHLQDLKDKRKASKAKEYTLYIKEYAMKMGEDWCFKVLARIQLDSLQFLTTDLKNLRVGVNEQDLKKLSTHFMVEKIV